MPIYFSRTGKAEHRELYADCVGATKEELRSWAIDLWCDLRQRQAKEGHKLSAAVWIGQTRCQPTNEEVEAHEQRGRELLEREAKHKESRGAEDEPPDVVEEEQSYAEKPLGSDTRKDEPAAAIDLPSMELDDDDDLDF